MKRRKYLKTRKEHIEKDIGWEEIKKEKVGGERREQGGCEWGEKGLMKEKEEKNVNEEKEDNV